MVIIAVSLVKKLKSNTNTFLLSLATADLLVSLVVMPGGMIQMIQGKSDFTQRPTGRVARNFYSRATAAITVFTTWV